MSACLLCEWADEKPADIEHAYCSGFADGVRAALNTIGPNLCPRHRAMQDAELATRGLKAARSTTGNA